MLKLFALLMIFISNCLLAKPLPTFQNLPLVYVKPNSKLTDINDQSEISNYRGFYAKVLEVDSELRDQFYIYDKEGKAKFLVNSSNVVEIEDDIHLLPKDQANILYGAQTSYRAQNKTFFFETEFAYNMDQIDLSSLNEFLNTDVNNITSPRLHFATRFISTLPINVGFEFNFQSCSWKDQNGLSSQLYVLSTGPDVKLRLIDKETYKLGYTFSYEFSPIYDISSSISHDTFSANLWSMGLVNEFETTLGKFDVGFHFRKHYLTSSRTDQTTLVISANQYTITSLGLSVGYKFNWEL